MLIFYQLNDQETSTSATVQLVVTHRSNDRLSSAATTVPRLRRQPSRALLWSHSTGNDTYRCPEEAAVQSPAASANVSTPNLSVKVDSHWRPAVRSPAQYGPERARNARFP